MGEGEHSAGAPACGSSGRVTSGSQTSDMVAGVPMNEAEAAWPSVTSPQKSQCHLQLVRAVKSPSDWDTDLMERVSKNL